MTAHAVHDYIAGAVGGMYIFIKKKKGQEKPPSRAYWATLTQKRTHHLNNTCFPFSIDCLLVAALEI